MADNEQQFKRNIAYKYRIGDLLVGKPVFDTQTERFNFLELGDKKIVRINIVGNIVDKYESEGDKQYIFLTIDDGSGQIKLKSFGDDVAKFKGVSHGQTATVIGVLRNFNNETYIAPEIIKETDPKYLLVRKLELEGERTQNTPVPENKEEVIAIKDKLIEKIKASEEEGGIEIDRIVTELRESSPEVINAEVQKLISEGIVFEPRPGKLRYLG